MRRRQILVGWTAWGRFGCGEGAEISGAGGVVGGVDAEVEVDGKEEVQLQRVELCKGEAANLRPVMVDRSKTVTKEPKMMAKDEL